MECAEVSRGIGIQIQWAHDLKQFNYILELFLPGAAIGIAVPVIIPKTSLSAQRPLPVEASRNFQAMMTVTS